MGTWMTSGTGLKDMDGDTGDTMGMGVAPHVWLRDTHGDTGDSMGTCRDTGDIRQQAEGHGWEHG